MSDRSVPSIKQLVSSANKIYVRRVDTLHKSLTYSKNSDVKILCTTLLDIVSANMDQDKGSVSN